MNDSHTQESPGTKPASGLSLVLQKINLVTALAALILFFLPWIDIQCSGRSMATQTGIQTISGGASPVQDAEAFERERKIKRSGGTEDDSMGAAPLVGLALLAVIGAVVLAFMRLCSARETGNHLVGMLCAVALALLALQMMIGFPVKKNLGERMAAQDRTERRANEPISELGDGMAQAMMMQIQIRHLPALYIELMMLGVPVLILANGLIDRMKRG